MAGDVISRRRLLANVGLVAGGALLGTGCTLAAGSERPWYELDIIGEWIMDNQLLWYLSHTGQGMADIGECLETASRIEANDESSWFAEWLKTADRVRRVADESLADGHKLSAGETYLRAANYYRAALIHYSYREDPRVLETSRRSVACFEKAITLLSIPAQAVKIPYEGTTLPGYFFRSPVAAEKKAPVLIVHQGFDAWPEETGWVWDGAIKRGYHCLLFHGPGQGLALRLQGLTFRPDWERVVTPVVDFALTLPGVDPERIVLKGLSFGGALAPRAVAFEKRIKICIANPGVLNWAEAIYGHFENYPGFLELLEVSPEAFNAAAAGLTRAWPVAGWWFREAAWKHDATSPADLMMKLREFNNEGVVDQIDCQVLIMDGIAEDATPGQAERLYDALSSPKDYMLFTAEDTGLVHCQTGASGIASQRMFDWLDENV